MTTREAVPLSIPLSRYPEILDVVDVADYLRLSPSSVRDLCARGVLPAFKPTGGRLWRVYRRELELYLATRRGTRETA